MIHQFRQNGYNIVLDVHSGGVAVVDDAAYRLLEELTPPNAEQPLAEECPPALLEKLSGEFSEEELRGAYAELYQMYRDGYLFSEDDYAQFADRMVSSPIKAMCLHISHDCQLR